MDETLIAMRLIHVIVALAWLGEVTVNLVLIPALRTWNRVGDAAVRA